MTSPREFLRGLAHAIGSPETYSLGSNCGLWLGLVLAIPLPVLAVAYAAPAWIVAMSVAAVFVWGAIVGAAVRVGLLGTHGVIRELRADAVHRERIHEEDRVDLQDVADTERSEHERLARLQHIANEELALGSIIQQSLVPAGVEREDLEIAVHHKPCTHVGGDYLQASLPRPDLLYLCVGDVAGHGVAAALVVSRIHALVQGMILSDVRPGPFLETLNGATLHLFQRTSFFMTFAVLRVDLSQRTIDYATAGHPPPWLLRARGDVQELGTPNLALGIQSSVLHPDRPDGSTTFASGDTLLLFTDGLIEMRAPGGAIWGEESLKSSFVRRCHSRPEAVAAGILRDANGFRGSRRLEDDVSLIVAQLGGPRVPPAPRRTDYESHVSGA